ncbi:bifunctional diaminohydroxyphosphoribosylaminopyrimidine deaminase/5-amino-6-(5-phosphoribosylamino)uracil reductase RibD [Candidatus Bipolaricaulota bacterium]
MTDVEAMRLAIALAELGEGDVNPNPLVGAVVLKDGHVVGRGYHHAFGGPHAEVLAIADADDDATGSTLVVTLEPCCCHGKTPPCTEAIIKAGIARVVVAQRDPSPRIAGNGIAALRSAGIEVVEGVLVAEAARQIEIFLTYVTTRRPFVQLKLACSLDGRIATKTGDSRWISGEASRVEGHRLRRRFASILVGVGTVVADDPSLSVRHVLGKDPIPIVLDPTGRIPADARLLNAEAHSIVVTSTLTSDAVNALTSRGASVWRIPFESPSQPGRLDLPALLDRLAEEGIDSVLIEGGGETAAAFLEADLVDKVSLFIAPILIGGRGAVPAIGGDGIERIADAWRLTGISVTRLDEDTLITGYLHTASA